MSKGRNTDVRCIVYFKICGHLEFDASNMLLGEVETGQQKTVCVMLKRVVRFSSEKSTDVRLGLSEVIQDGLRQSRK